MKRYIIFALIFGLWIQHLKAQNNTLFFMSEIPQSIQDNPAMRPTCRFFFNVFDAQVNVGENALNFNDIFTRGANDSLYFDFDKLYKAIPKQLNFRANAKLQFLSFGFKIGKIYWSFFSTLNTDARLGFPRTFFDLKNGNWDMQNMKPRDIDFTGTGINSSLYTDNRLAASYEFTPDIHLGAAVHIYNGIAVVNTYKSSLKLLTDANTYDLSYISDIEVRTNVPVSVSTDSTNKTTGVSLETTEIDKLQKSPASLILKNPGFGIDLGVTYKFTKKLEFGAAINNLGYITWNDGSSAKAKGNYTFSGIDFSNFITADSASTDSLSSQLLDSITGSLDYNVSSLASFKTGISPNVTLSATFRPTKHLGLGAMAQTQIYDGKLHQSLTLSGNFHAKFINFGLTYSMMNRTYANIGFGMGIKFLPFQWYIVSDTWSQMASPYRLQNISLRTGITIILGCKEKKDLPMYNEEI